MCGGGQKAGEAGLSAAVWCVSSDAVGNSSSSQSAVNSPTLTSACMRGLFGEAKDITGCTSGLNNPGSDEAAEPD